MTRKLTSTITTIQATQSAAGSTTTVWIAGTYFRQNMISIFHMSGSIGRNKKLVHAIQP